MPKRNADIIAKHAEDNITYFLSCYRDLQTASYHNSNLEAFELQPSDILWYEECGSTNDVLLEKSKFMANIAPTVCIAQTQSAGRGQHGRDWLSGNGNLHMSVLYPARQLFELDGKLALEVAMSLIDMPSFSPLKLLNQGRIGIKWPNDLCFLSETHSSKASQQAVLQKFGGILIEPVKDNYGSLSALIIGVGINVNNAELTNVDGVPIANIQGLAGQSVDLTLLAAEVFMACQHAVLKFLRGSSGIFARYYLHDLLYDKGVEVVSHTGKSKQGVAAGVDIDGSLKLAVGGEDSATIENIFEGQVRLL